MLAFAIVAAFYPSKKPVAEAACADATFECIVNQDVGQQSVCDQGGGNCDQSCIRRKGDTCSGKKWFTTDSLSVEKKTFQNPIKKKDTVVGTITVGRCYRIFKGW